ncbi:MAG: glycosyltransferase family 39 protein [Candidatus Hydrogenedentes bacterium]|nr:glycosyltransferase family 39 protein [Candidatus Hydrogenedentota bacterium]
MYITLTRQIARIESYRVALLVVLLLFTTSLGAFYSIYIGEDFRYPDERDYYKIARNVASSFSFSIDGEEPTAYRPPGYPLFLVPFIFLGADVSGLRILNFVLVAVCMYLTYRILSEHASPLTGVIGVLGVVCYPVLFYTAGTLYPQILGAMLLLFIIQRLCKRKVLLRDFLVAGVAFGYLILTIPFFLFMLLPITLWLYWIKVNGCTKKVAFMLAAACIPVLVWCVRNYTVFDSFVLVSTNSGENLLLGNSENSAADSGTNVDIAHYWNESDKMGLDEIGRDKYFQAKAIEWIWNHKTDAIELYCKKFFNHFSYSNDLWVGEEASPFKDKLMLLTYWPLLIVCIVRILMVGQFRLSAFEVLLVGLYIFSGLVYAVFFTRIRFRLPFDFLLICLAAMFMRTLYAAWRCRSAVDARSLEVGSASTSRRDEKSAGGYEAAVACMHSERGVIGERK